MVEAAQLFFLNKYMVQRVGIKVLQATPAGLEKSERKKNCFFHYIKRAGITTQAAFVDVNAMALVFGQAALHFYPKRALGAFNFVAVYIEFRRVKLLSVDCSCDLRRKKP